MSDLREQIMSILQEGGAAPAQPAAPQPAPQAPALPHQAPTMNIREQVAAGMRDAFAPQAQPAPRSLGELAQQMLSGPAPQRPNPRPMSNTGAPAQAAGMESSDPSWTFSAHAVDRMIERYGMKSTGDRLMRRLKHDMRGHRFATNTRGNR